MADEKKSYWDKPSVDGFGVVQAVQGIPNKGGFTNVELVLHQGNRIAEGVEALARRTSDADSSDSDNSEEIEKMRESFEEGIRQQSEDSAALQRELDEISESNKRMAHGIDDIGGTARRIENIGKLTLVGVGALSYTTNRIAGGIDDINYTLDGVYDEVSEINEGIRTSNAIQERQRKLLGKVNRSINKHGKRTNELLTELSRLAVEHIRMEIKLHELTIEEIKRVAAAVVFQIVLALHQLAAKVTEGLDSVRKSTDRVANVAEEIRDAVNKNTGTMVALAKNSEAIKAEQYREEGRVLLRADQLEEAVDSLKKAFSLNKLDFETNRLLAYAYINLRDNKSAKKHLDLTGRFSDNKVRKALFRAMSLKYEKSDGDNDAAAKEAIEAVKNNPAIYYSHIEPYMRGIKVRNDVFVPLITDNDGNANVPALCAVELIKLGDEQNAEKAVANFLGLLDGAPLDSTIRGKFMESLPLLVPLLGRVIERDVNHIKPVALLQVAAMLLEAGGNDEVALARKNIVLAYKTDEKVVAMRKAGNYSGIVEYFRSILGGNVSMLKKFGELSQEFRSLIK